MTYFQISLSFSARPVSFHLAILEFINDTIRTLRNCTVHAKKTLIVVYIRKSLMFRDAPYAFLTYAKFEIVEIDSRLPKSDQEPLRSRS